MLTQLVLLTYETTWKIARCHVTTTYHSIPEAKSNAF